MRRALVMVCVLGAAAALGGCERRGNLRTARDFTPPPAPTVAQPFYDPYAAPSEVHAVWRPAVVDRRGTVIAPGRPEGEEAAGRRLRPRGTF